MHKRDARDLWPFGIRLYFQAMKRKLYNLPLVSDARAFWAFLDAYAASLDVIPDCSRTAPRKSADALWEDFVRVASDANSAFRRNTRS